MSLTRAPRSIRLARCIAIVLAMVDVLVFEWVFPQRRFRLSPHMRAIIGFTSWVSAQNVFISVMRSFK